jgi:hypothetical protein
MSGKVATRHIKQSNRFANFEHDGHVPADFLYQVLNCLIAF